MFKNLTLLVGPPGSGKSTYAKNQVANGFTYVNQDTQGVDHLAVFDEAMLDGKPIVVDRMNFNKEQRSRYLKRATEWGYNTHIVVLHECYDVCLARCTERVDHPTIKDRETAKKALGHFFTRYERVSDDEADKVTRIWNSMAKEPAIICDLDGTLCNVDHRLHFVRREGKKDWKAFFDGMVDDKPNQWCVDLLRKFEETHQIVYCSGRPSDYYMKTKTWLENNGLYGISDGHLYMRHSGDHRKDNIVKEIILDFELLTRFKPYFMIDDRTQVVDMWRSRGYTCLQCANGDF